MNSDPCACSTIDGTDHAESCVGEVFSERYASDTDRAPESDEPYDPTTAEPPLRPEERHLLLPFLRSEAAERTREEIHRSTLLGRGAVATAPLPRRREE